MPSKIMQYIYLNIFLLPETAHTSFTARIFVLIGALSALTTAVILFYIAYKDRKIMLLTGRILYYFLSLFFLWAAIIYGMASVGLLSVPGALTMDPPSYGNYLRPILSFLLLSPALIALYNRERK